MVTGDDRGRFIIRCRGCLPVRWGERFPTNGGLVLEGHGYDSSACHRFPRGSPAHLSQSYCWASRCHPASGGTCRSFIERAASLLLRRGGYAISTRRASCSHCVTVCPTSASIRVLMSSGHPRCQVDVVVAPPHRRCRDWRSVTLPAVCPVDGDTRSGYTCRCWFSFRINVSSVALDPGTAPPPGRCRGRVVFRTVHRLRRGCCARGRSPTHRIR